MHNPKLPNMRSVLLLTVRASSAHGLKKFTIQTLLEFTYYGNSHTTEFVNSASGTVQSKRSTSRLGVSKTLRILVSILHHHCIYH